ncbi:MAG: hypothetical protein ACM3XO_19730 [Bacteroidota bacterium]
MLNSLGFLLGEWQALSRPGEPTGGFTFASRLQGWVIVRTNDAEYAATDDRPAFRHEDLMVIYRDEEENLLADYYDSEGHVIHYAGQAGEPGRVIFTSLPAGPGPRFRIGYRLEQDGTLTGTFETASPAQPESFLPYLAWSAVKAPEDNV